MLTTLLLLAATSFSPTELKCAALTRGVQVTLQSTLQPKLTAALKVQRDRLSVRVGGHSYTLQTMSCTEKFTQDYAPVQLADFNFDGVTDLAVLDGVGYGGVNVFYRLYFTDPGAGKLRESQTGSQTTVEMGTLQPDPLTRTLQYAEKDGPAYSLVTLCPLPAGKNFYTWDFYTCRATRLNAKAQATNDSDGDWDGNWDYVWFDPSGKEVLTRRATPGTITHPERFTLLRKSFFAPRPGKNMGKNYVVTGDTVEVLEVRGDWFYAVYQARNGRRTAGWLARRDLK